MALTEQQFIKIRWSSLIFIACFLTLFLIVKNMQHFNISAIIASNDQIRAMQQLIVKEQAQKLSLLLKQSASSEEISEMLNETTSSALVTNIELHSNNGSLIAGTKNPSSKNQIEFVEPIFNQKNLIGFVKVSFDDNFSSLQHPNLENYFNGVYAKFVIIFLISLLLTSCFYKLFRPVMPDLVINRPKKRYPRQSRSSKTNKKQ